MKSLLFATACIDLDPGRYQNWLDYYAGWGVDLLLVNDGPLRTRLNLGRARLLCFSERLGRPQHFQFPGWTRSFFTALYWCEQKKYTQIAHVESDCYIFQRGKEKFLDLFHSPGYYAGWCPSQHIPESGLQILNDPQAICYYMQNYNRERWHRVGQVEVDVEKLGPTYILQGDRHEGHPERYLPHYDYMAQLSVEDLKGIMGAGGQDGRD